MCYSWGPHAEAQKKNGSGRPCSAPGKMRALAWRCEGDYNHGAGQGGWLYAVGRKNCDMTGRVLIGAAWPHPVEGVVGRFPGCWQKFQKLDNQSKFSKERFSRSKLCRLALARMLPHKAEVEGSRRLQLQFPDAELCRQQANGTTGRCFESWESENTKKNAVKPPVAVAPAQGSHHRWGAGASGS